MFVALRQWAWSWSASSSMDISSSQLHICLRRNKLGLDWWTQPGCDRKSHPLPTQIDLNSRPMIRGPTSWPTAIRPLPWFFCSLYWKRQQNWRENSRCTTFSLTPRRIHWSKEHISKAWCGEMGSYSRCIVLWTVKASLCWLPVTQTSRPSPALSMRPRSRSGAYLAFSCCAMFQLCIDQPIDRRVHHQWRLTSITGAASCQTN